MERIWKNVSDGNRGGACERSVSDWDEKRDVKNGEKRGDDQELAREVERGQDKGCSDLRHRARIRDRGDGRDPKRENRPDVAKTFWIGSTWTIAKTSLAAR